MTTLNPKRLNISTFKIGFIFKVHCAAPGSRVSSKHDNNQDIKQILIGLF